MRETVFLNNDREMPLLGLGVYKLPDDVQAEAAVTSAISAGYRMIDTASVYKNEESVGKAIAKCGIPRKDLFITSKIWNTAQRLGDVQGAFSRSLDRLKLSYVDLYLIHWPASHNHFDNWEEINVDTWKAMMELYRNGKVRAIGISNFMPHHMEALLDAEVKPMVNQLRYHPGMTFWDETIELCRKHDILIEAYSPLGTGTLLDDPVIAEIAGRYGKSPAQLCIRWCMQKGTLPLPKSVTPSRIAANADVFDFEISTEDMQILSCMPQNVWSGEHPEFKIPAKRSNFNQ